MGNLFSFLSFLNAGSSTSVATLDSNLKEAAVSAVTTSFTLADRKRLNKQRTEECHRAVTRYLSLVHSGVTMV